MSADEETNGRVSLNEVARASGVSVATASRALNGQDGVSSELAGAVKGVADKLANRPLRTRKPPAQTRGAAGSIAIITLGETREWLQKPVMATAVNGIHAASDASGYRLILSELMDPESAAATLSQKREIDGAILFISSSLERNRVVSALNVIKKQLPVVWAMGGSFGLDVDHVCPHHLRIGQMAHEYLRNKGCREVAYVTTSPQWPLMRLRAHGFSDSACDAGSPSTAFIVTQDQNLIASYGPKTIAAGNIAELAKKIAAASPALQGIFMANDQITSELYPQLLRQGLRPGGDLIIVSCDNEEARLAALDPRPATIDVGADQIGRRAIAQLLSRIQQPDDATMSIHITPRLILPED